MTDYINRKALLKMIGTMPSIPLTDREERLIRAFISTVKNFPAADVREVVLCKDCRYARECVFALWMNPFNFCSKGKRQSNCGAKMEASE